MTNLIQLLHLRKRALNLPQRFIYRLRHNELIQALTAVFLLVFLSAVGVTFFEHKSNGQFQNLGSGLWWAMVTVCTVGYGDIVPQTVFGRVLATVVMLSGVVLLSVFTAAVSTTVITKRLKEGKGLTKLRFKNHIALLGWNPAGLDIIRAIRDDMIRENRSLVLINQMNPDQSEAIINRYQDLQIKFVSGDYTDEAVLIRANIGAAHAAIILPDESNPARPKSDERTILATLSVKAIESKVKVIAHILDPQNEPHMRRANADRVVVSDRYSGYLIGAHVISPGIPEMLDVLISGQSGVRLGRRKIAHHLLGKNFAVVSEYFLRQENAILLGFIKEEAGFKLDDILATDYSAIDRFIREKLASAGKGLSKRDRLEVILQPPADYIIVEKDIAIVLERYQ